jgi:murein L,D-transpeptidase YafK
MRLLIIILTCLALCSGKPADTTKAKQITYTRVREAYSLKGKVVDKTLAGKSISKESLRIYFRAFKNEKILELWAKNSSDTAFVLLKEFTICDASGDVGPKRRYKDLQVPEGFYRISELNPFSKYYLSVKVNYPNASDSIRGVRGRLGNFIFIHGSCVSSGCLAMTDDRMREIYVYCVEALNAGQEVIPITIYPAKLTDATYARFLTRYAKYKDDISLWGDLKKSYDLFNLKKVPPIVKFLPDGKHEIQ